MNRVKGRKINPHFKNQHTNVLNFRVFNFGKSFNRITCKTPIFDVRTAQKTRYIRLNSWAKP